MRIVDAESQLVTDLIDEIEVVASKEHDEFAVTGGRHPTLGKVVIVKSKAGDGLIVEVDE
jgi:hypothetical protein